MAATILQVCDIARARAPGVNGGSAVLTRIDHVGIACRDLAAKIAFYESVFGLTVVSVETNEDQGVREAMLAVTEDAPGPGTSYVQLLEPLRPDTPVGRFLGRRGEGVHHVGYGVADLTASMAGLQAAGIRLLDRRPRHGSLGASIAFLHPSDVGGVLTELVQSAAPLPRRNAGNSN
jgi:methylmalonyl-CoA/ethylmalonyl-CoA epimerase